jgi:hypothetical protein
VIELLLGLVRMFAVKDTEEALRLRCPEKFVGEWRLVPRDELAEARPRFLDFVTSFQMAQFLKAMERWGIIDRYRGPKTNRINRRHIRFNAGRLLEILTVDIPRARRDKSGAHTILEAERAPQPAVDLQPLANSISSSAAAQEERAMDSELQEMPSAPSEGITTVGSTTMVPDLSAQVGCKE